MEQIVVNGIEIIKFKGEGFLITVVPLCLWNTSKDRLNGCVYDFSIDYDAIAVDDKLDIHKYLMEKNNIKWCLGLLKKVFLQQWLF